MRDKPVPIRLRITLGRETRLLAFVVRLVEESYAREKLLRTVAAHFGFRLEPL